MGNYKELYFKLSGKVADAIDSLIKAQQEAEEEYLIMTETEEVQDD